MSALHRHGIMVLPHELPHGYATHCLERGTNPRAIQQAMGHKSLETTQLHRHDHDRAVDSSLHHQVAACGNLPTRRPSRVPA
jgi:site-specific recombinase XerC